MTTIRKNSWKPLPLTLLPLLKGRGRTFRKLGGGQTFLLERGEKPVKRGVDVEMGTGVLPLFVLLYSSVQSHLLCVGGSKVSLYYFSYL